MTDESRAVPRTYDYGSYYSGPIEVEPAAAAAPARPVPAAGEIPPAEPVAAPAPPLRIHTGYSYFGAPESPQGSPRNASAIVSAGRSAPLARGAQNSSRSGSPAR